MYTRKNKSFVYNLRFKTGTLALCALVLWSFQNIQSHAELVGYWRFEEGSGSVIEDSSGKGNNGELGGRAVRWTQRFTRHPPARGLF